MVIPLTAYSSWSLPLSAIGASIVGVFLQDWRYSNFPPTHIIIFQIVIFGLCAAVSAFILMLFFKILTYLFGYCLKLLGEPDKIRIEKGKDGKLLELIVENNESEEFSGELKIMKVNDEKFGTPLLMGVVRGENIASPIIIPKGEPIKVGIGLFDDETGKAYFVDFHKQKVPLNPQTRIYTKLSGNLKDGTEIIKEDTWFINYKDYGSSKKLGFANLIEIKSFKI